MVVSSPITGAAIIGGELVLSLPSGQIINCGLVQGPPGPKGSVGLPGPKGDAGLDGCTLLHGPGFPDPGLGKSGDFYWMVSPEVGVFGPKTAGGWGSPVILSRPITANKADYKPIAGQSGGGGADGGSGPSKVYTNQVIPTGSGRLKSKNNKTTVEYYGSPNGILAPSGPLNSQANINGWIVKALEELDAVVPVAIVDSLPAAGEYTGDLVLFEGSLYIWAETEWIAVSSQGGAILSDTAPVGDFEEGAFWFCTAEDDLTLYVYLGDGSGQGWIPAAPPVSLEGIESSIANVDAELMKVNANIAMNKRDIDEAILDAREDQERQDGELEAIKKEQEEQNEAIGYNARECTQLRSRIGDIELGQTKQDERIDALEAEEDDTQARLFGSPFVFRQDKSPESLAKGEFTYDSDMKWYAHKYDAAGDRIGISTEEEYTHEGMLKVYKHNGVINIICIMHRFDTCKTGQADNDHFMWKKRKQIYTHTDWLEDGTTYYLSDGYLLPQ